MCKLGKFAAACAAVLCAFKHPKFNRKAGDWRLRSSSPGVDQGKALDWMDGATDLTGAPRIQGVAPDIGCHEDFVHGLMLMVR